MKEVTLVLIALGLPCVFGQSTPSSSDTSTDSVDDIFSLNDEDFKLWIAGSTPKAWETSTRRVSTSTQSTTSDDNRLLDQLNSFDQTTTTSRQEIPVTTRPTQETTPKIDSSTETGSYFYHRPGNLQEWLQTHMLQSHQINNQLMTDVVALSSPPRYVGSIHDCNPASETQHFRPASASFQTVATIHRFHDNTPSQQLPFPGNSHQGDAFLSQNQNQQKPQPAPGQRITDFHGYPHFYHRPSLKYLPAATEAPPLLYGYY